MRLCALFTHHAACVFFSDLSMELNALPALFLARLKHTSHAMRRINKTAPSASIIYNMLKCTSYRSYVVYWAHSTHSTLFFFFFCLDVDWLHPKLRCFRNKDLGFRHICYLCSSKNNCANTTRPPSVGVSILFPGKTHLRRPWNITEPWHRLTNTRREHLLFVNRPQICVTQLQRYWAIRCVYFHKELRSFEM